LPLSVYVILILTKLAHVVSSSGCQWHSMCYCCTGQKSEHISTSHKPWIWSRATWIYCMAHGGPVSAEWRVQELSTSWGEDIYTVSSHVLVPCVH